MFACQIIRVSVERKNFINIFYWGIDSITFSITIKVLRIGATHLPHYIKSCANAIVLLLAVCCAKADLGRLGLLTALAGPHKPLGCGISNLSPHPLLFPPFLVISQEDWTHESTCTSIKNTPVHIERSTCTCRERTPTFVESGRITHARR